MLARYRGRGKPRLTVGEAWKTFRDRGPPRDVLFWSGGKDSFLALRALQQELKGRNERVTLLTTFDGATGRVPFQDSQVGHVPASRT